MIIVPLAEEHAAGLRAVLDSVACRRPHFLALADGAPVGWCDVVEKPRGALRHSGVLGMGVLAAHRGRGLGGALLRRTLDDAREKGFTRVELTVRVDNERARKLYEKHGFQVEGLCRRHMRVRGAYYDSHLMAWLA
ncbi:MAG TPA: GNAT family N-acetyltransferase [Burkholderiales bacterium]